MFATSVFINFFPHPLVGMEGKNIEDVSSFFLFEATGDSEADSTPLLTDNGGCAISNSMAINDAESCSDDAADPPTVCEINGCDLIDDEEEEEEEEQCCDYEAWSEETSGGLIGTPVGFRKSSASADSTKEFEMLNEVEKNRLFWETCLAS